MARFLASLARGKCEFYALFDINYHIEPSMVSIAAPPNSRPHKPEAHLPRRCHRKARASGSRTPPLPPGDLHAHRIPGRHELVDDVELLASELVTNAYRHAGGPCSLRLTALRDGRLRVGVRDGHPHIPAPFTDAAADAAANDRRTVPPDTPGGRGLHLVREYAETRGAWSLGDVLPGRPGTGKLLWFEVGAPNRT